MTKFGSVALAVLAAAAMPAAADAAFDVTLSFTQPTGTAVTTDHIPVYVTLTVAADSSSWPDYIQGEVHDTLVSRGFDFSQGIEYGLAAIWSCADPSFGMCSLRAGAYALGAPVIWGTLDDGVFNWSDASSGGSSVPAPLGDPGSSTDVLFGEFVPKFGAAAAPERTYSLAGVSYVFSASGYDASGVHMSIDFATWTTPDGQTFTRDVVAPTAGAVPKPATWAMMIAGFGLVGATMRRRKGMARFA